MTPMNRMLDAIEWVRIEEPFEASDLPYVTHMGTLKIDTLEILVVQLNTGERIIPEAEMVKFFEWMGVSPSTVDFAQGDQP